MTLCVPGTCFVHTLPTLTGCTEGFGAHNARALGAVCALSDEARGSSETLALCMASACFVHSTKRAALCWMDLLVWLCDGTFSRSGQLCTVTYTAPPAVEVVIRLRLQGCLPMLTVWAV